MNADPLLSPQMAGPFLDVAQQIGDRLVGTAIWERGRCSWTGDEIEHVNGRWQVVHRAIEGDLYNGAAGIARFLAHLWRVSREDRYRATALAALAHSLDVVHGSSSMGLWNGAAGVACVACEAGTILGDVAVSAAGLSLADRIARQDVPHALRGSACDLDLVSGLAGTLVALVHLARRRGARHEHACAAITERLIAAARYRSLGASWPMREGQHDDGHLCGLAHGAAGVALALMEAHALVGDHRLAEAAWNAVEYENCWFDADRSSWPDLRTLSGPRDSSQGRPAAAPVYSWSWCHGAAGIGTARLRLYELTREPRALADAGAALHAAGRMARPLLAGEDLRRLPRNEWNFSVCHGIGSVIELALYAYRLMGRAEYLRDARALACAGIHAAAHESEWRCGVPDGGEHPGLMVGLAGIGLEYLAVADPRFPPATMWL